MNAVDRLLLGTLRSTNRWRFGVTLRRHGRLVYLESRPRPGPTVVLLHGLGASKDQWGPAVFGLTRQHHCLFIDMPGHGESLYQPTQGYGPQALLAELEGLLVGLGERPVVLVGSSLGGCVAALYAARHPQRVERLVLLAPAGLGEAALGPALKAGLDASEGIFGYRTVAEMKRFWQLLFEQPPQVAGWLARAMAASGRVRYATVQQVVEDCRREGLGLLVEQLPRIVCRTLVIWGRNDQVFPPTALPDVLRWLPQARGQIIENAGHVPYLERGGEVVAAITQFMAATPAGED